MKRDARSDHLPSVNWSLLIGSLLVAAALFVAIAGPGLAPKDPMESKTVIQVGDKWLTAPYPPFTVPGYPLGSDELGRDLASMLLWAVRPTIALVATVAAIRLIIGIVIGLWSGWSANRFGRALDALITAALAAPVLIVALAVMAGVGVAPGRGLWAFILGLSLTGWAETARVVREQTRSIKGQLYIEAARALGQSAGQIVTRHVLPHIMPLLWMLLAFEISGTLLGVAGLGFSATTPMSSGSWSQTRQRRDSAARLNSARCWPR